MHGRKMGSHGYGARKKHKKSGHKGGKGMAGSGKRADQKKTLVTKLYGNKYFGKQGITSKGTKRDIRKRINLKQIEMNIENYKEKGGVYEVNLKNYKILGTGDVKNKLKITAKEASQSAIAKVKKAGGEIILPIKKEEAKPVVKKAPKKKISDTSDSEKEPEQAE